MGFICQPETKKKSGYFKIYKIKNKCMHNCIHPTKQIEKYNLVWKIIFSKVEKKYSGNRKVITAMNYESVNYDSTKVEW